MSPTTRHDFQPWPDSDATNRAVARDSGGVCMLSFSAGKDSIATWLELRRHFTRVVPVYCYLVPELAFIEESLAYYEQWFGTRIVRMAHPRLYDWLRSGLFQSPHSLAASRTLYWPRFTMDDVFRTVREDMSLPKTTPTAIGVLASDTPMRRAAVRRTGPRNVGRNTWFPIYDWTGAARYEIIHESGCALPVDYQMFGRSFDGLQPLYVDAIARHFPADYARIADWFPLIGAAPARRHLRATYGATT